MKSTLRPAAMTYMAYVLFLLTFVALGTFVYALAAESTSAWIIGSILVVVMVASTAGFRAGARSRARSNDSGIEIEGANIWEQPLRRDEIDRYLLSYRGEATARPVLAVIEPPVEFERRAA